ncbi:MAG: DUF3147 family protein [Sulfuricella sp.]|nr:DUF3147 family protein [Sulfuricella sp.]
MIGYAAKVLFSAVLVVLIAETAKRSSLMGALLASIPVTSLLAFVWVYLDTGDLGRISELSLNVFWLVVPSLALFLLLPWFIRLGWGFWTGLLASSGITALFYGLMVRFIR